MSEIIRAGLGTLPSIICTFAAFRLAAEGREGWGWLLFAAVCMAGAFANGAKS